MAIALVGLFAILEYCLIPKGKDGWIDGAVLLLGYWTVAAVTLLPITLWTCVSIHAHNQKRLTRSMQMLVHSLIAIAALVAPRILIPWIYGLK
ncbi:MAG: hypothetical protein BWK77_02705 [Verrucomicrobia bacterium A1]|nr:MAG: hypothetical protein BWK77_02705 [Verrucomicrobia bacterium A1]